MTQFPDLFACLAAPFQTQEVRARTQGGRQVQYITARTAMNRLDSILGPEGWWDEFIPGENSVLCRLTIRLPDGTTLTKADAGGYAGMTDQGDDDKSGYSDSFKRAAVKFGVGRYLYRDGVPDFGLVVQVEAEPVEAPARPPAPRGPARVVEPPARPSPEHRKEVGQFANKFGQTGGMKCPRSGRALWAWCKEQEETHAVTVLKYMTSWGKLQDFPGRMNEWDEEQAAQGFAEAVRKLKSISVQGDAYEDAEVA